MCKLSSRGSVRYSECQRCLQHVERGIEHRARSVRDIGASCSYITNDAIDFPVVRTAWRKKIGHQPPEKAARYSTRQLSDTIKARLDFNDNFIAYLPLKSFEMKDF